MSAEPYYCEKLRVKYISSEINDALSSLTERKNVKYVHFHSRVYKNYDDPEGCQVDITDIRHYLARLVPKNVSYEVKEIDRMFFPKYDVTMKW